MSRVAPPCSSSQFPNRKETEMHACTKRVLFSAAAGLALALCAPARADAPPSPWMSEDIGFAGKTGATQVDATGLWTIQSPAAINPFSQVHLTYQHLQGDGSIIAHFE